MNVLTEFKTNLRSTAKQKSKKFNKNRLVPVKDFNNVFKKGGQKVKK